MKDSDSKRYRTLAQPTTFYGLPYALLDSGQGARLERFGDKTIVRPSKLAVWKRRDPGLWKNIDVSYEHKKGWAFTGKRFESWEVASPTLSLILRLQESGQVGLFPEHLSYLKKLSDFLSQSESPKVLNLFAYTGVASVVARQAGALVTHVDLSKKALEWAQQNFTQNKISDIRLIKEDAISFLKKEVRRGNRYDVVIADPPSFSRISQGEEWQLEEVLSEIISLCTEVLHEKRGLIILSSHHFETGGHVMGNLLLDTPRGKNLEVSVEELAIQEEHTARTLSAGYLVTGYTSLE